MMLWQEWRFDYNDSAIHNSSSPSALIIIVLIARQYIIYYIILTEENVAEQRSYEECIKW